MASKIGNVSKFTKELKPNYYCKNSSIYLSEKINFFALFGGYKGGRVTFLAGGYIKNE